MLHITTFPRFLPPLPISPSSPPFMPAALHTHTYSSKQTGQDRVRESKSRKDRVMRKENINSVAYLNYGHSVNRCVCGASHRPCETCMATHVSLGNAEVVGCWFEVHDLGPRRAEGKTCLVIEVHWRCGQRGAAHYIHHVHGVTFFYLTLHQHDVILVDLLLFTLAQLWV